MEAEVVKDPQNILPAMTDVTIMADLNLQPCQSRVWLSVINTVLQDLILEELCFRRTEDTLVLPVQWPLLLIAQATTGLIVLSVLTVSNAPIANVLIANL